MTISTTISRKIYAGNDSTTSFPTTFQFFNDSDLLVTLVDSGGTETVQTITTHYTVTGGSGSTGTVEMITAPATGETLVIERNLPYTQDTDYSEGGNFSANTHESALDSLCMQIQQVLDETGRSLKVPISSSVTDLTLPVPSAGKGLVWNVAEDGFDNTTNDLASIITDATTQANNAATSATNAATSASNAATSATNAATSETNAATSATNAATSETNAAASAAAAAASMNTLAGIKEETGTSYSVIASDAGKLINLTNAAAITVTMNKDLFTNGQQVALKQGGAGQVTINAGTNVTLEYESTSLQNKTLGQHAIAVLIMRDDTTDDEKVALTGTLAQV